MSKLNLTDEQQEYVCRLIRKGMKECKTVKDGGILIDTIIEMGLPSEFVEEMYSQLKSIFPEYYKKVEFLTTNLN
jgi:hypothetical protein